MKPASTSAALTDQNLCAVLAGLPSPVARTVVDRLVDEIPLRLEGRSCDEHLFRTESDPERTSVSSSPTEELALVAPTGADDDDEQAEWQVDGDDLADAVEAGAGARPVLSVDGPFEYPPRSVE